jgi:hypothetical protein
MKTSVTVEPAATVIVDRSKAIFRARTVIVTAPPAGGGGVAGGGVDVAAGVAAGGAVGVGVGAATVGVAAATVGVGVAGSAVAVAVAVGVAVLVAAGAGVVPVAAGETAVGVAVAVVGVDSPELPPQAAARPMAASAAAVARIRTPPLYGDRRPAKIRSRLRAGSPASVTPGPRPSPPRRYPVSVRRLAGPRFARWSMIAALALMLAAPDHWGRPLGARHDHGHESSSAQEAQAHARHCHGDAATCTDLPLTGVGGLAALQGWLAMPASFVPRDRAEAVSLPADRCDDVIPPPPRLNA